MSLFPLHNHTEAGMHFSLFSSFSFQWVYNICYTQLTVISLLLCRHVSQHFFSCPLLLLTNRDTAECLLPLLSFSTEMTDETGKISPCQYGRFHGHAVQKATFMAEAWLPSLSLPCCLLIFPASNVSRYTCWRLLQLPLYSHIYLL